MSDDTENSLRMALKAVVGGAVQHGYDPELLCEDAIDSMRNDGSYESDDLSAAAQAIEATIDELLYPSG
jgi:ferric-dicitrate binding protein FerR (iron transport regulator)